MIIFLMGGMIYLSKYEVPKKRKRSYMVSGTLFIAIAGGMIFIQKGSSPYIYIELKDKKIFINDKDPKQTRIWFKQVSDKAGLTQ
ncbi:hypothetical protein [Neobacillus driksii]|uniref:hypothetical protein n=1 Tax=Neobacillus driksii TaxID=3035913 RepID=UPI0027D7FD2B|nr:hypothetical protein [Neobacillus niacini]